MSECPHCKESFPAPDGLGDHLMDCGMTDLVGLAQVVLELRFLRPVDQVPAIGEALGLLTRELSRVRCAAVYATAQGRTTEEAAALVGIGRGSAARAIARHLNPPHPPRQDPYPYPNP